MFLLIFPQTLLLNGIGPLRWTLTNAYLSCANLPIFIVFHSYSNVFTILACYYQHMSSNFTFIYSLLKCNLLSLHLDRNEFKLLSIAIVELFIFNSEHKQPVNPLCTATCYENVYIVSITSLLGNSGNMFSARFWIFQIIKNIKNYNMLPAE